MDLYKDIFERKDKNLKKLIDKGDIKAEELINYVMKSENFIYIQFLASNLEGINLYRLEKRILDTNNIDYIYNFVKNVEVVNFELFEKKILDSDNIQYIYSFAKDLERTNIISFEDKIIKLNNAKYIYYFALNVEGCNIQKLESALIELKDYLYIYEFACKVKGANLNKLIDVLIQNCQYSYLILLLRLNNIKKETIIKAILDSKQAEFIILLPAVVKNINMNEVIKGIIKTKNLYFICEFAIRYNKVLSKQMINKLADAVVNITLETSTSLLHIETFITRVKRAPVSKLSEFLDSEIQEKKKILKK